MNREAGAGVGPTTPKACKTTPAPVYLLRLNHASVLSFSWEMGEAWEMINVSVRQD